MDFRYVQYDPSLAARQELLNTLRSLFHHLLLQTSGDVDEALRWLERIAERYGLLSADVSIDDFKKWLEEQEAIEPTPQGFQLTHRGERAIRQESLDAIFSALGKDGAGDHRVSSPGDGIERLPETRPWEFGDSYALVEPAASLRNTLRRGGAEAAVGDGLDVREEDLEGRKSLLIGCCCVANHRAP